MKLKIFPRPSAKKSEPKQNRRQGEIPAVLYGGKSGNQTVAVKKDEFEALLRSLPVGRLATTVLSLEMDGSVVQALVKEVQYHPVTYAILHLDLLRLEPKKPISVQIPIELIGKADCAGVKLGGSLRHVIRSLKARCTLETMPSCIEVDVQGMQIGDAKKLQDLPIPSSIQPLAKMGEVAIVVAKKG